MDYYYPISKEDKSLSDLEVSQCYFIGDKEAAKIQGGVWAHGPNNSISHCIFYGCRNAVLFFDNVAGFRIEHSIISHSYESAFWFPREDVPFTFSNNVVIENANVLVMLEGGRYSSPFSYSVITNNKSLVGYWSRADNGVMPHRETWDYPGEYHSFRQRGIGRKSRGEMEKNASASERGV